MLNNIFLLFHNYGLIKVIFFCCVRYFQDKVLLKEIFKKIRGKVENLDVKNTIVAPFVQEKN